MGWGGGGVEGVRRLVLSFGKAVRVLGAWEAIVLELLVDTENR